jgi:uncharacterized cupin superfamily protein
VLAGSPTLRTPDGERELAPGDCVVFRRGPEGAHSLHNTSAGPARFVLFSTLIHPDVAEYPDSGKVLAVAGAPPVPGEDAPVELVFDREQAIGYWEREP